MYIYRFSSSIKLSRLFRILTTSSFVILLVLSYIFLNPTSNIISNTIANIAGSNEGAYATDTPATSGTPFPSLVVLNVDLTHPNASVELTPHDGAGTFSSSSEDNSVAFNVSTNNYTGYTLYISSSSDDGYLSPAGTTTPTAENSLSSIDEITTESDFSNPSSTTLNNKWGYKPSIYNSEANTSFIPAPTTTPTALDTTSTYDTTKDGELITSETNTEDINANTYTIGLGARVDSTIPTGAYEAAFNLSAVGNPVPVTIYYQDISNDATVDNLPETYEGAASETRSPISTTTPTRTGYTFISWCLGEVTPGTSENDFLDTCTGTTYAASNPTDGTQYVGIDRTKNNIITLKAMWRRDKYMQTVQIRYQGTDGNYSDYTDYADCTTELYYGDTHSCSIDADIEYKAASIASYTVTGAETKQITVDRQKYAQTIQARYQGTDGNYGSYSTYDACTADVFYGATHSCSYTATAEYKAASVASYTVTGTNTKQMDVARQIYTQTIQVRYQNTSGGWGSYSNYASCTKDIYYGVSHSCSIAATTEYKAASVTSYTVTGTATKQMDVARQTYQQTIQIRYQNANSSYGSYSTYSSCTKAVYYGASHSCSYAGDTTYNAASVASYTVTGAATKQMSASRKKLYMQDITTSSCPSSRTLVYDSRDSKSYYIQKIGSVCWMTSNLNIAGGTTLTPSTSNVTSNYTLPTSSASGFTDPNVAQVYNSGKTSCTSSSACYSYYTWRAATAGTGTTSIKNTTVSQDICPKGWRLPTKAQATTLINSYNSNSAMINAPFYGSSAGIYYKSKLYSGGKSGSYPTNAAESWDGHAVYFSHTTNTVSQVSVGENPREYGTPVRCVAK